MIHRSELVEQTKEIIAVMIYILILMFMLAIIFLVGGR